jgi:glutamate racemase
VNVGCDGLEDLGESGRVGTKATTALLKRHLEPVRASDADVVGLGCTHYPFLRHRIKTLLGPGFTLYDPSKPVARRVRQVLAERELLASNPGPTFEFYTTGDAATVQRVASRLLRRPVSHVTQVEI